MSLNWKEIDLILEELAMEGTYIRQISQRDYRNIYFQLSSAEKNCCLRICLEQDRAVLYETDRPPSSKGKQPRFSEFLRARIRGGRIESAKQIACERIVHLRVCRGGKETMLYVKLWGNAANIIVCDTEQRILEAAYRRPRRDEIAGKVFQLPESSEEQLRKLELLQPRPAREGLSYNQSIAADYKELGDSARRAHLLQELERHYSMKADGLRARITRIEKGSNESANRLQTLADSILSQAWKEGELPSDEPALDPSLSAVENAQRLYARAKKIRARNAHHEDEKVNILDNLERIQGIIRLLNSEPSLARLEELHEELQEDGSGAKENRERRPGLNYFSQGFQILVGRTAKENELLLRRFTRGNDTWLHTRDYPGAYVFIKQRSGKSIPLDVLLDAGSLALHYSKAKKNGQADLYYTQVKYLRRPKKGKPGLVLPSQEKNLFVRADEDRMKRLLKSSNGGIHAVH